MVTKKPEKKGFIDVTGGKVWYIIVGDKKGIPLIVLHGGPGHPHDTLEPLEDLSDERQIIFYDQLGCGNSERPDDNSLWNVDRFVEELGQIVNALNLDEFYILGHSWGCGLGVSYALTKPNGLKGLILADPFLSTLLWEIDAKRLAQSLPEDIQRDLNKHSVPRFNKTQEFKRASDEFYKQFVWRMDKLPEAHLRGRTKKNDTIYNMMWGPKEFAATGNLKDFDLTDRLSEVKVPVLLLCGRFDEATPETTAYFKTLFPNAQMRVFENSAHLPHWTDREKFMKTVGDFLRKVDDEN